MINPLTRVATLRMGPDFDSGIFLGTCFSFLDPSVFVTAAHCVDGIAGTDLLLFGTFAGPEPRKVEEVIKHEHSDLVVLYCPSVNKATVEPFTEIGEAALGDEFCAFGFPVDTTSFGAPNWKSPYTRVGPTPRFFRGHFQRFMTCHFSQLGYKYFAHELSIGAPAGLSGGPVFSASNGKVVIGLVTENHETSTHLRTITDVSTDEGTLIEKVHAVLNYAVCLSLKEEQEWLTSNVRKLCGMRFGATAMD